MTGRWTRTLLLGTIVVMAAGAAAQGQDETTTKKYRVVGDKFQASIGGFLVDADTSASINFGGSVGTSINFEEVLGLPSNDDTMRIDGFWRFTKNRKHAITFGYSRLDRTAVRAIKEEIQIDDTVFKIGAVLDTKFNTQLFNTGYRYSFVNNGRTDAGVGGGFASFRLSLELSGIAGARLTNTGQGVDRTETAGLSTVKEAILIPIPVAGMFIDHAVTRKLVFRGAINFFSLNVDKFQGLITDTRLLLEYYFIRNLGLGIGTARTRINITIEGDDRINARYGYGGFTFYLTGVF